MDRDSSTNHWSDGEWFAVPSRLFDDGTLASITRTQLLTMLGLYRHSGFESGRSYPGVEGLAKAIRCHQRTVQRARMGIVAKGLAKLITKGGGHMHTNIYQMTLPNSGDHTKISEGKTLVAPSRNPGGAVPKPWCGDQGNKEEQKEEHSSNNKKPAAAGSEIAQRQSPTGNDLISVLKEIGIADPKRSVIADLWANIKGAEAKIRKIDKELRERGKGSGVVVLELETSAAVERAQAERRAGRERHLADEQAERHRRRQQEIDQMATPEDRNLGLAAMKAALHKKPE